jgi:crotonobetainyl-CoA:carnitine CoA-transferase CaiB-like acyl-CoA transferase
VFADPQAVHSGSKRTTQHSTVGEIGVTGFPYRFGNENLDVRTPPPVLGEQSAEILAELGFTKEEIAAIGGK